MNSFAKDSGVLITASVILLFQATCIQSQAPTERRGNQPGGRGLTPFILGSVVSIDKSCIVVRDDDGDRHEVRITPRTSFVKSTAMAKNNIKTGDTLLVHGMPCGENAVRAMAIDIQDTDTPGGRGQERSHGGGTGGPVRGEVVKLDPLTVRTGSGESTVINMSDTKEISRETAINASEIKKETRVRIISPPGAAKREAIKIIAIEDDGASSDSDSRSAGGDPVKREAGATVDFSSRADKLSTYIAGTTAGPFYDSESFKALENGKFKLIEVLIWLSPPRSGRNAQPDSGRLNLEENIRLARSQIRSIFEIGAEPLVFMITSSKPSDMKQYEKQVRQMCEDLRNAARGAGKELKLFRFGNEPESKQYWQGSRQDFFETYGAWARVIKSISSNYVVQAPGFLSPTKTHLWGKYHDKINEFSAEFLDYCSRKHVPLDSFSFHYYGTSIDNLIKEVRAVRSALSRYPELSPLFGVPKIAVDEWNIHVFGFPSDYYEIFDTAHTAAHNIGAVISMLNNGVWLSIRFGGTAVRQTGDQPGSGSPAVGRDARKKVGDFLMMHPDGAPKPVYYAFTAFNNMFSTPVLLNVQAQKGMIAIAGKSTDGKRMNIVACFYDEALAEKALGGGTRRDSGGIHRVEAEVVIDNFPWASVGEQVAVLRYVVDDERKMADVEKKIISRETGAEKLPIAFEATVPSVVLIQIEL